MNQDPPAREQSSPNPLAPITRYPVDGSPPIGAEFTARAGNSPSFRYTGRASDANRRVEVLWVLTGMVVGLLFVLGVPPESVCTMMFALSLAMLTGGGVLAGLLYRAERSGRRRTDAVPGHRAWR